MEYFYTLRDTIKVMVMLAVGVLVGTHLIWTLVAVMLVVM